MYQHEWNEVAEEVDFNLEIDLDRFINEVAAEQRILDYGCGYGRISKQLWNSGYHNIVGVDSSQRMIERGSREHPELQLSETSGETLPFLDHSFDAIVACAVFTCITSEEARASQLKELYRILKPKGMLHMVEFCSDPRKSFTSSLGVPMLHSSPKELRELVGSLQITSESIINTNTMTGHNACRYSLFARKSLNKRMQPTQKTRG